MLEPRPYSQLDLLRRLEREVGPIVDSAIVASTPPRSRSVLLRAAMPTLLAMVAMAAAVLLAWPNIDAHQISTTGVAISANGEEQMRDAHADTEVAQQALRAELAKIRKPESGFRWYEDSAMLMYRSPWRPR